MEKNKRVNEKIIKSGRIIFWGIYFLFFLPIINKGVDVTDTSFYLVKYKYFLDNNVSVHDFGIVLTELIGGLLYNILPSYQLLCFNVLGIAAYCTCGLLTWKMLKEYKKEQIIFPGIFGANLLAISFIKTLNYNVISALLFYISVYCLVSGLMEEKRKNLYFSGVIIGLNVFTRFPNILHLAIGIAFLIKGVQEREWKKTFYEIVVWGLGIITGLAFGIGLALIFLDSVTIANTIKGYFVQAGSSTNVRGIGYGIKFMYRCMIRGLVFIIPYLVIPMSIILILRHFIKLNWNKACMAMGIMVSVGAGLLFQWSNQHRLDKLCLIYLIVYVVLLGGVVYFINRERKLSILCGICLAFSIVGVFGSDTYIQVLGFFSYLPVTVACLTLERMTASKINSCYRMISNMICAFLLAVVVFGGIQLSLTQVYRDEPLEELTEELDSTMGPFAGMETSIKHKEAMISTQNVLKDFQGEELLFMGDFNVGCLVSDMVPFFNVPWPDLLSFSAESFKTQLEQKSSQGMYPVVMMADKEKFSLRDISEKEAILREFMKKENYEKYFQDEYISVYIKKNKLEEK